MADIEMDLQPEGNEVEMGVNQGDQENIDLDVSQGDEAEIEIVPESQEENVNVSVENEEEDIAQTIATAENAAEEAVEAARQAQQAANDAEEYALQTRAAVNNINNNLGEVEQEVIRVRNRVNTLEANAANHVSSGEVEDGVAYFYNDEGDTLFSITGIGGGGGGGGDVGSVVTLTNNTGWASTTVAENVDVILSFSWSSLEDGTPTGNGVMTVEIGGAVRESRNVAQGNFTVNVRNYLNRGDNRVVIRVTDGYGKSKWKQFTITQEQLRMESTFDDSEVQTGALTFTFTPYGAFNKTIHFELDGTEMEPIITSTSGRQMSQVIRQQTHGAHTLRAWFTTVINGQTVQSNTLMYDIIWAIAGNNTPIISSSFSQNIVNQYTTLTIPFMVYTPNSLVSNVTIKLDGMTVQTLPDVSREMQSFQVRMDEEGNHTVTIQSGTATKVIGIQVNEADINVEAETEDLLLYLTSTGRSNLEANPAVWEFTDADNRKTSATLTGFNFVSNGWIRDSENVTALRVNSGAQVSIPFTLYAEDFRRTGATLEIEFAVHDVQDYTESVISCMNGGRGFDITAQTAGIASEQSHMNVQYKDEDHVRISFVYEKRAENRLLKCYINGIPSRVVQYPDSDDFTQVSPVGITIDGTYCTVDVYNIRIYGNNLTGEQLLGNWIADTQDGETMLQRYSRNNIYDAYGEISISKLPGDLPYMVVECPELPQYKGDKKSNVTGRFVNPSDPSKNFTFEGCQMNVQGTSSAVYPRKNYDMQFKSGFETNSGHIDNYQMVSTVKPFNRFVMKADVASSEGANNVELVKLYCDMAPYKTREMLADPQVRQGIYGFPIVIFWTNTDTGVTTFLGKYNFNFPKRAPGPYGYHDEMESWEFQNNTSDLMLFKTDYFDETMREDPTTGEIKETWRYDYEARFPDDTWTNYSKLQELQTFVYSTYRAEATGDALSSPVTYDGVTYTNDTAEYRLAKFRAEIGNYAEIQSLLFYYVFTEFFLLADSRAKNLFIGFSGSDTDPTKVTTIDRKAVAEPYDMDTALGINNEGSLTYTYSLEDTDVLPNGRDIFTGQKSVLWNNVRDAFPLEIRQMYQTLRSNGLLTYENIRTRFENHQAIWPEAVWIEDSRYKYIDPLVNPDPGKEPTDAYLEMMLGSKMEQRRWWLSNRFRYMDSKWSSGDALSEVIQFRAYARSVLTITPYSDLYVTVKYGSYTGQERTSQGTPVTIDVPIDTLSDTETYVYSASQIADVGDMSGFNLGWADFSHASRIQRIKIGDSAPTYQNLPFERLTLGNNRLLKVLDVRNCPNLGNGEQKSVNMSGCTAIQEAYFDGTSITGVELPNGSPIRVLHLPETITNLTLRNQTSLTELDLDDYTHITTLWLENPAACVDTAAIVADLPNGCRVRLYNFHWDLQDLDDVSLLFDRLDNMRGLDQNGNNVETAQVFGSIHVVNAVGSQIDSIQARYPDVRISYDHITSYVYYYSWDGNTLIATKQYVDGQGELYTGSPARTSTAQYDYSFEGWALTMDAEIPNPHAFDNVTTDRRVYAAYSRTLRSYTVYFNRAAIDGGGNLQTLQNVPYGTTPEYTGQTPTSTNPDGGIYTFIGWTPEPGPITGDTTYLAAFYDSSIQITYMNGSTQYDIEKVASGTNANGPATNPTKASSVSTIYTFSGWSSNPDATEPDPNALINVTAPRTLYAIYAETARTYTITFVKDSLDGGGTLQTKQVAYGTVPEYTGTAPTTTRTGYEFAGWIPALAAVTGNQTYTASFVEDTSITRMLIKRNISVAEHSEVTSIGQYAFYSCSALTTISFPMATSIGSSAFTYCNALTTVSFPELANIGNYAFHNCSALTTISFPVATSIGEGAFTNCSALTTASFSTVTSIGVSAFVRCSALTIVSFPMVTSIGKGTFYGCWSLATVSFPLVTSIGQNAFYSCSALTTASFPSVTSIGQNAFYGCKSLTTVSFPVVTSIGSSAFANCGALTAIILVNSSVMATFSSSVFQSANNAILYVADELLGNYKNQANLASMSASRIKGISELPT